MILEQDQDGGREGDPHLLPQYIKKKKKSPCGMIHTEHLLKAGRSQTSKKGNETSK